MNYELIRFTPQFYKRLQQLKIRTRRAYLGNRQGGHVSLRKGFGMEFSDYKLYTMGDDFRNIDWGAFARSDRLYTKQFREDRDLNVVFLIDGSASMSGSSVGSQTCPKRMFADYYSPGAGRGAKFDFCRALALALGYVALTDGDTVSFSVLGQNQNVQSRGAQNKNTRQSSQKFSGPKSLVKAEQFLAGIMPGGSIDFAKEVGFAVQKLKTPGKCFIISDFLCDVEEVIAGVKMLIGRSFEVVLFQVLDSAEINLDSEFTTSASKVTDAETGEVIDLALDEKSKREYVKLLADHVEQIEKFAVKSGVPHVLISTEENIEQVVLQKLLSLGLLR